MSRRGTAEKKTAKSDPIYHNQLVNMWVNRIMKHGKKALAYQILYLAMNILSEKLHFLSKEVRNFILTARSINFNVA